MIKKYIECEWTGSFKFSGTFKYHGMSSELYGDLMGFINNNVYRGVFVLFSP